jgi:hypothetical protein
MEFGKSRNAERVFYEENGESEKRGNGESLDGERDAVRAIVGPVHQ